MKMMHGACFFPSSNRSRTREAPTPAQKARAAEKLAAANEKRRLRVEAAYDPACVQKLHAQFGYGAEIEALLHAGYGNFAALAEFLAELRRLEIL